MASELKAIQAEHGRDAVAVYYGNPTAHSLGLLTYGQVLFRALRTRNRFSATSVDQLPHMLAGLEMLGHQLLLPGARSRPHRPLRVHRGQPGGVATAA